jgi:pimeloyl-ACP methyl ester carboxylesterase
MADWKRSSRRILMALAVAYFFLCVCGCALQRKLLFFPTKIPADAVVQAGAEHGFVPWKNNFGQIIGWEIPANGTATGSVLIVHGNAGSAVNRDYLARPIHDAEPVDVFVLEYPGYGARGGSPSKKSFVAAAEEAFQLLPANSPKYVVSESIGAGVACELAKNHPLAVAGMVLFVPSYFLLVDRFNPEDCLKSYHGPVKFVIAGKDEVIGPASGLRLANSYNGTKELQVFPGAHHNDVSGQPAIWWQEVFLFWQQHPASVK